MGFSVLIPKSWYRLIKIDGYDLVGCHYRYYYCRSKKRIIRVCRQVFEPSVVIKPILVDGKFVYKFWTYWDESFSIDHDRLIDILKTELKGESLPVYLDDLDDVDLERRRAPGGHSPLQQSCEDLWSEEK